MNKEIITFINNRLQKCEQFYNIKVLAWFPRDRGIYRKNSDLDIVFLFKRGFNSNCSAIHDIIEYGFDFWGWNIEDAVKTLAISNENYYSKAGKEIEDIYLSKEHARGGLGYFGGVYWMVGNTCTNGIGKEIENTLLNIMEKRIIVNYLIKGIAKRIDILEYEGRLSSYEYLNSIWRILLGKGIMEGNLPGKTDFKYLLKSYADECILDPVNDLWKTYENALGKHSQRFDIPVISDYIIKEYTGLKKETIKLEPEKKEIYLREIDWLKNIIACY